MQDNLQVSFVGVWMTDARFPYPV